MYKYRSQVNNVDYWKFPQKPYPRTTFWEVVAGPPNFKLNELMDHDIIFDEYDYKIRKMDPELNKFIKFKVT